MNTQTFAQVEDFKALTDEELMAVNGGGFNPTVIGIDSSVSINGQTVRRGMGGTGWSPFS